jgi:hypothetical protein
MRISDVWEVFGSLEPTGLVGEGERRGVNPMSRLPSAESRGVLPEAWTALVPAGIGRMAADC